MFKLGDARKKHTRRAFAPLAAVVMVMLAATTVFATPTIAKANPFADAWNGIVSLFAGDAGVEPAAAGDVSATQADNGTQLNYQSALSGQNSTVATGRVWTDKSVFTGDLTFSGDIENSNGDKSDTTQLAEGEKFLVSYSALATTEKISGKANVPVDVVFVVDNSNSMDDPIEDGWSSDTRLEATVKAVNASIKTVMDSNPYSRVAVVLYGRDVATLMELGRYNPMSGDDTYISCDYRENTNRFTAATTNGNTKNVSMRNRGTNIHMGVDAGMDILVNAAKTSTTINGKEITHLPALILLSDGAATYKGSNDSDWWNPWSYGNKDNEGSPANVLAAIMNASYQKQQVDKHYGLSSQSQYQTKVYTIGMGLEQLSGTAKRYAQIALNPAEYLDENRDIKNAWDSYLEGYVPYLDRVRFNHPPADDIVSVAYNDGYYAADDADQVAKVFDDITSSITTSVPQIPTDYDSAYDPNDDGALTYTDPIGQYMEVKDIKKLIYAGKVYTLKDGEQYTGPGTYHFKGTVTSPVDGQDKDLGLIELTVSEVNSKQTLTVKVPAGLIPLRVNEVTLGTNDQVESHDVSGQYPMRLVYSVGFDPDVLQSDGTVDFTKIDSEYAANHRDAATGNVWFYSNEYTPNADQCGDATVSFRPSMTNPFYFVQQDVPLYTSKNGEAATGNWSPDATYYYPVTYYEGNEVKTIWRDRLGGDLAQEEGGKLEGVKQDAEGKWYIAAGKPRLVNLGDYENTKKPNTTGTAASSYHVEFVGGTVAEGHFEVHLGNNGRIGAEEPGTLTVNKTATIAAGFTGPVDSEGNSTLNNQVFTFKLTLSDAADHRAQVFKGTDKMGDEFTVKSGDTFTLKNGETLYIYNITKGTTYKVEETEMPGGFKQLGDKTENAEGTIAAGTISAAKFTNEYKAAEGTASGSSFQFQKSFDSWDNNPGISFEFWLVDGGNTADGLSNNPFPAGATVKKNDKGQRYISKTVANGDVTNFGDITFTLPGTYTYSIYENTPLDADEVLGVDYSQEAYTAVVTVTDKGSGNLEVTSTMTKTADKGGQHIEQPATVAVVTNTYTLENVHMQPVGTKVYTNTTGDSSLKGGEFTFHVKAITAGAPVLLDGTDDDAKELPKTDNGAYEFKNAAGGSIAFGNIRFTKDNANKTYVYEIWEDVPAGAENGPVDGMTYDTNHYFAHVKAVPATVDGKEGLKTEVTFREGADETSDEVQFDGNRVEFRNSYTANPAVLGDGATAAIAGQKTLNGRDWLNGEEFNFALVPTDDKDDVAYVTGDQRVSTKEALQNGVVKFGEAEGATEAKATATVENVSGTKGKPVSFNFGKMTFAHKGTYTFKVTETPGSAGGVTYDGSTVTVTVKVTDDGNGQLNAAVTYNNGAAANASFTNEYKSSFSYGTAGGLDVVKNLSGRNLLADGEFQFTIKGGEGTKHAIDTTVQTDKHTDRGTCTMNALSDLSFTQEDAGKTFVYEVDEVNTKLPQVTYDPTVYTVEIEVIDDNNGSMHTVTTVKKDGAEVATFDSSKNKKASVTFSNTYEPNPVTVDTKTGLGFTFAKKLTGRNWNEGETFSFTMKANNGAPMPKNAVEGAITVPVNETEAASFGFGTIEFTQDDMDGAKVAANGTKSKAFTYTVKEDAPKDADGMTYDRAERTLTITVTDDGQGRLSAKASLSGNSTFTNEYGIEEDAKATVTPTVEKWVEGRDSNVDFSFVMKLTEGDAENVEGLADDSTVKATVKSGIADGESGTAEFGGISFTKDGEYTFTVTEDKPASGWTDVTTDEQAATHEVTFKVSDNGKGGYNVTPNTHKAVFANSYEATTPEDGVLKLEAEKTLSGRDLQADDFTFGIVYAGQYDTTNESPNDNDADKWLATGSNDEHGKVTFSDIKFDSTKLSELADTADSGVTKNNGGAKRSWTVRLVAFEDMTAFPAKITVADGSTPYHEFTVTVTDEGNGKLSAALDNANEQIKFANKYTPGTHTYSITIKKQLVNRNLNQGEFSFALKGIAGGDLVDLPEPVSGVNDAGKKDSPDGSSWTGNVNIGNGQDGKYAIGFTSSSLNYAVDKNYATVKHDGAATTWTVKYALVEDTANLPKGVEPNTSRFDLTFTVKDDGKGVMSIEKFERSDNLASDASFTFKNTYDTTYDGSDVTAKAKFTKVLEGRNWKDSDSFTFEINGENGAPLPVDENDNPVSEVMVNEGNAKDFSFGTFKYTLDDVKNEPNRTKEFTYTVSEKKPAEGAIAGVEYDDHTATLKITVKDNGEGRLVATASVENNTFTNIYSAKVNYIAKAGVQLSKTLNGRDMADGQFAFTLSDFNALAKDKLGLSDAKNAYAVTAADDGKASSINLFNGKMLEFTDKDAGTYSFDVTETKIGGDGYTNDTVKRHVAIVVAYDKAQGVLSVTTTVTKDGQEVAKSEVKSTDDASAAAKPVVVPFTNSYDASTDPGKGGTTATVAVKKTLTGRPMTAGEFAFNVTTKGRNGGETTVKQDVKNAADGTVDFGEFGYTIEELNKAVDEGWAVRTVDQASKNATWTLHYTAFEVTDGLSNGVTATHPSFDFDIVVVDNGNGSLTATAQLGDEAYFENVYSTDNTAASIDLAGSKILTGRTLNTDEFSFTAKPLDGAPALEKADAKNDASGNVNFGTINFTLDDLNKALGETEDKGMDEATEETADEAQTREGAVRSHTFYYEVTEQNNGLPGVTYDQAATKKVGITVTDDGQGHLTAKLADGATKAFTFTNSYDVTPTTSTPTGAGALTVTKTLTGCDMAQGEFTFELVDEAGNVVSKGTSSAAKDGEAAAIEMAPVEFTGRGSRTQNYTLREVKGDKGGVEYDGAAYPVAANVVDNGDGTLSVTWSTTADKLAFNNSYSTADTTLGIVAAKTLTGRDLKDGEFSFKLQQVGTKDNKSWTAKNDANGQVTFPVLTFVDPGNYEFEISETKGKDKDVSYDETVYKVNVAVTDDGNGHLTAEATYVDGDPVFKNTYTKPVDPTPAPEPEPTPEEPAPTPEPEEPKAPELPQTGDDSMLPIVAAVVAGAACIGGGVALSRRRK